MPSYITITDPETDPEAPLTSELAKKWRDNPIAIVESQTGAPINQAAWHPYNRLLVGGSQTGLFYDFAVSGAVSEVITPDFADGYEYRVRLEGYSQVSSVAMRVQLFQETSAVYSGVLTLLSVTGSAVVSGVLNFPLVRKSITVQPMNGWLASEDVAGMQGTGFTLNHVLVQTAQKITRARFTPVSGNIDGGKLFLDRRTVHY